ncbi:glutamine--fructose-6-phosphate aminotransferase, partial [Shewanella sp. A25]|nr:glutamine--fructose-6-phosphate aminotransferase [Shewanella shenzhenensis]
HNGIIENFAELKTRLQAEGRTFRTDTDTEVVAQLLDRELASGRTAHDAFKATLDQVRGAFALVIMVDGEENLLLGARRGPPLVVGYGEGEMFLGSDSLAVGPFTNRVSYLEDGVYVAIDH